MYLIISIKLITIIIIQKYIFLETRIENQKKYKRKKRYKVSNFMSRNFKNNGHFNTKITTMVL